MGDGGCDGFDSGCEWWLWRWLWRNCEVVMMVSSAGGWDGFDRGCDGSVTER